MFLFYHDTAVWNLADSNWNSVFPLGSFFSYPDGMTYKTYGDASERYGDVFQKLTAEEL